MTISKGSVIKDIQECYDKHGYVNRSTLNNDEDFCSGKTVYNKFGSFKDACKQANVPHNSKPQKKDKIIVSCENCGNEKEVYPYRVKESTNDRFFCDNKCQGIWWSDNLSGESNPLYLGGGDWSDKMGSMWHVKREKCLERDNYSCKICGITQSEHLKENNMGLDVHHIEPRRKFYKDSNRSIDEANKMENLVTLCREHHNKVEYGKMEVEL